MSRFYGAIPDVLLVLGLLAVAVGAGLVFVPAGLIVGGLCFAGLGLVLDSAWAPGRGRVTRTENGQVVARENWTAE